MLLRLAQAAQIPFGLRLCCYPVTVPATVGDNLSPPVIPVIVSPRLRCWAGEGRDSGCSCLCIAFLMLPGISLRLIIGLPREIKQDLIRLMQPSLDLLFAQVRASTHLYSVLVFPHCSPPASVTPFRVRGRPPMCLPRYPLPGIALGCLSSPVIRVAVSPPVGAGAGSSIDTRAA